MVWARVIALAAMIALTGSRAGADLPCNNYEAVKRVIEGPRFQQAFIDSWQAGPLTFYYYRNILTGTWTVLYTWEIRPMVVHACVTASGVGPKERKS